MMAIPVSRPINLLVVHHSASPRQTSLDTIRAWHLAKGWQEIGYHWVIDGGAVLRRGRELKLAGAHAAGHNTHSFGICVTGDNTDPEQRWSPQQELVLANFLLNFRTFFPVAEIIGHRDLHDAKTLCPGLDLRAWMRERRLR